MAVVRLISQSSCTMWELANSMRKNRFGMLFNFHKLVEVLRGRQANFMKRKQITWSCSLLTQLAGNPLDHY